MRPVIHTFKIAAGLTLIALLDSCSHFSSHYNAVRHENFTKLYAFHSKFIEDFSDSSKQLSAEDARRVCDQGDLKFREALIYARSQDNRDSLGTRAVRVLEDQFQDDCALAMDQGVPLHKEWADEQLLTIKENYGRAIQGELWRFKNEE